MVSLAKTKKYYWDACAWLGLINEESAKHRELEIIWKAAENGQCVIYTSTVSQVEVYKKKCERGDPKPLSDENDKQIAAMFWSGHVKLIQLDANVAESARSLLRAHQCLKKAPDAIHLATALHWNCDVMHTYDGNDLLDLDGKLLRRDGENLEICLPDTTVDGPLFAKNKNLTESEDGEN